MKSWLMLVFVVVLIASACGGSSAPAAPAAPPAPPPAVNRAPSISSVTVNPTFGVQDFGLFTFNVSATDPDGDILTFAWNIAGNARAGSTAQIGPFTSGGIGTASVTASDGKGGTATGSVQFIVGSMTGNWSGGIPGTTLSSFTMTLTQFTGGLFNGTINTALGSGQVGPTGAIATINASGAVTMRIKIAPFTDAILTGQMDGTGARVTGSVQGSGFTGQAFTMSK